jgi:hypothetical protein
MTPTTTRPLKPLNPRTADAKYTGTEPEWRTQPTSDNRISRLGQAFYWYGYHYGKKEVKEFMITWLSRNQRQREAREFARVPDTNLTNVYGWLARMNVMGLELTEHEHGQLDHNIRTLIDSHRAVKEVVRSAEDTVARPTIQDRLREKMTEAAGELEAMYDDMILAGGKMSADFKPMAVIRGMNVAPQMVGEIAAAWRQRLGELEEVLAGKDVQLAEGYGQFGKLQIRNMVKFAEQVVADCGSYVQIKKTERAPRKKKPVSAEKLTQRFRYLREFAELKLTSEPVTKLVNCQEAWLYDTKKRKLIYAVADTHVGTMTVKGTSLVGFDTTNSVQKTLRKPAEQIKALLTGGVANTRKFFRDIRATEVKFNGRSNENLILLKVR